MKKKFGYMRVSTQEQNEARQYEALTKAGIEERDIFLDKQSGHTFVREQYQIMKNMLREGDVLYIQSLDRFGRNQKQILREWEDITNNIKADIVVLDMPLLDTTKHKDSLGTLISDLVLQVLSWVAEEERRRLAKRQREGIDIAQENGVRFGRPPAHKSEEFLDTYARWKAGEIKGVEAFKELDISKTTFYKLVRIHEGRA